MILRRIMRYTDIIVVKNYLFWETFPYQTFSHTILESPSIVGNSPIGSTMVKKNTSSKCKCQVHLPRIRTALLKYTTRKVVITFFLLLNCNHMKK